MGNGSSKPKQETGTFSTFSTLAPTPVTSSAPCLASYPNTEHLLLAFFAGVLLTLLLMAFVLFIINRCRKCHYSPQVLDPHSDPSAKLSSIPEDSLTYASMTFKTSEEKSNGLDENHPANSNPTIYAQIKMTDSPSEA